MPGKANDKNPITLILARCDAISEEQAGLYRGLLSEAEWARNRRYRFERDRHRDLIARALLRTELARRLGVQPQQLAFVQGEHGKPELLNTAAVQVPDNLHFNLSHAGDCVVLAIAQHRVGVDIEYTLRTNDVMAIADRYFFGSEIKELYGFPESQQKQRFFDYWTLKEAYMKARGEGISLGLDNFGFSVVNARSISIFMKPCLNDSPEHWQFLCATPEPDYRLALAINSPQMIEVTIQECIPLKSQRPLTWNLQA